MKPKFLLLLLTLYWAHFGYSENVVTKIWDGHPISIHMHVKKEVLIRFPESVEVKFPSQLKQHAVLINNQKSLLIRPISAFDTIFLEVTLLNATRDVLLLSVDANLEGESRDWIIQMPVLPEISNDTHVANTIALLIEKLFLQVEHDSAKDIFLQWQRVPMHTFRRVNLYPDSRLALMPVGMWMHQDLYATLVLVRNMSEDVVKLDTFLLGRSWLGVALKSQHTEIDLGPHFSKRDSEWVALISDRPFAEMVKNS